ncbi:MAG: AAA family ATPase [Chitinophagales bacterium]
MAQGTVYIAATNQHVGKTTSTLGLMNALKNRSRDVGYCKPCGEKFLEVDGHRVDKDAVLFADIMNFSLEPRIHSPIIAGGSMVTDYIDQPNYQELTESLQNAAKILENRHEVVVYEGTGHPGVCSVVDYSNAQVAKFLNTGVVLIVEGGIGSTVDRLMLCKHFFAYSGVQVHGVIINKVLENKMDKVQNYLHKRLEQLGIEIFGFLPFEKELAYPQMSTVKKTLRGEIFCGEEGMGNLVQDYLAGSLTERQDLDKNVQYLLMVSSRRLNAALDRLRAFWKQQNTEPHLAGLVLTGDDEVSKKNADFLKRHHIATIRTNYDTYEAITKLNQIEVKINTKTPQKVKRAIELFDKHVDVDRIVKVIGLG